MGSSCCKPQKTNLTDTDKVPLDKIIAGMKIPTPTSIPQTHLITSNSDIDITESDKSLIRNYHPNQANLSFCDKIPIVNPHGPFRFIWDSFVILALLYTSIAVPYTLTFGVMLKLPDCAAILALLIDIFLLIDIIITFRTAYVDQYDHLHLVTSPKHIAKQYLKSWFWLDLISSFPFEFVIPALAMVNNSEDKIEFIKVFRVFRLLRGLKMLRVLRIFKVFRTFHLYTHIRTTAMVLKCVRCLAAMLITTHYFACFWYLIGYHTQKNGQESWLQVIDAHHDNPTNFTKYSYSWYWAIVTLFTTGYGDIHAYNELEQWTASICILIGTCFFAYFIGVLTTLLAEGDRVRMYELERVEEAQLFCAFHRIPRQLARAIVTHIRYHCNYNYLFDHERIMESIPNYLQNHVTEHLAQSLCDLDMFKHLPLPVIGQIALKMTSTSCNSGHTLFNKGELSHEFYIQRTGRSVLHRANKKRILERGDVCGEYAILSGQHRDTVKCLTWSEFYVLDINDLLQVLKHNYIDTKTFHSAYKNIKTVLRKTLQKATKRKVQFETNQCEFIHELSNAADATQSVIAYTYYSPTYEKLHMPSEPTLVSSNDNIINSKLHYQQLKKIIKGHHSSSSGKLIKKLSGLGSFLQRENSAGRHELVIKKPNALAMNVEKLDTAHHSFEYSDHEDSHFFSDIKYNHDHDPFIGITPKGYQNNQNHNNNNNNTKGRIGGSKFGHKKKYKYNNNTKGRIKGKINTHNINEQINEMLKANNDTCSSFVNSEAEESHIISMDSNDIIDHDMENDISDIRRKSCTLTVPNNKINIIEMTTAKSITSNQSGTITPTHKYELDVIKSKSAQELVQINLEKLDEIVNNNNNNNNNGITPTHNDNEMEKNVFLYNAKEINSLSLDNIETT